MIQTIANALGDLRNDVVFVGGATTAFYIDDPGSPNPTPSDDVDFVIEIASQQEYAQLENTLRKKGFKDPTDNDIEHPICRKIYQGIQVDVMPTDAKILGFANKWYADAIKNKVRVTLPDGLIAHIFNVTYFLATKLEAFSARGKPFDIRTSQDLEDILAVLDGCSQIESDLINSEPKVRQFIQSEFKALLKDDAILEEAAHGFIRASGDPVLRAKKIVSRMRTIANKK